MYGVSVIIIIYGLCRDIKTEKKLKIFHLCLNMSFCFVANELIILAGGVKYAPRLISACNMEILSFACIWIFFFFVFVICCFVRLFFVRSFLLHLSYARRMKERHRNIYSVFVKLNFSSWRTLRRPMRSFSIMEVTFTRRKFVIFPCWSRLQASFISSKFSCKISLIAYTNRHTWCEA